MLPLLFSMCWTELIVVKFLLSLLKSHENDDETQCHKNTPSGQITMRSIMDEMDRDRTRVCICMFACTWGG